MVSVVRVVFNEISTITMLTTEDGLFIKWYPWFVWFFISCGFLLWKEPVGIAVWAIFAIFALY
jgi:hypothetical protein